MSYESPLGKPIHVCSKTIDGTFKVVLREHSQGMSRSLLELRDKKWVAVSHTERFFKEN